MGAFYHGQTLTTNIQTAENFQALQAGFFYLPVIFWSKNSVWSGVDVEAMVRMVQDAEKGDVSCCCIESQNPDIMLQRQQRVKVVEAIRDTLDESVRLRDVRRARATVYSRYLDFGQLDGQLVAK